MHQSIVASFRAKTGHLMFRPPSGTYTAMEDLLAGFINFGMWGRLGWQEVQRRYRRTLLGPFWATASLGIFIFTMGIVWAGLWKINPKEYLPYLSSGMIVWVFVAAMITEGTATFTSNEGIIKQFQFSYTILAMGLVWRNLIIFFHNLVIYICVVFYADVKVTAAMFLVIPGLILACFTGVWVGLLLGMLCSRFRDINQIINSLLQISMFITPIFWKASQIGGRFEKVTDFNFLFHYVDVIRSPLLGEYPRLWSYGVVLCFTVIGWTGTYIAYKRFRHRVAYWI